MMGVLDLRHSPLSRRKHTFLPFISKPETKLPGFSDKPRIVCVRALQEVESKEDWTYGLVPDRHSFARTSTWCLFLWLLVFVALIAFKPKSTNLVVHSDHAPTHPCTITYCCFRCWHAQPR